jgi:hypothetical protein
MRLRKYRFTHGFTSSAGLVAVAGAVARNGTKLHLDTPSSLSSDHSTFSVRILKRNSGQIGRHHHTLHYLGAYG